MIGERLNSKLSELGLTQQRAADRLKKGRTNVKGMWSEKKQTAYDAAVILCDTGGRDIDFKLEFPKNKRS